MDRKTAHLAVAEDGEAKAAARLAGLGYDVKTVSGNSHYDLLVNDCTTVEVKTALPTKAHGNRHNRWQFEINRGRGTDQHLFVLVCKEGAAEDDGHWYFVIPGILIRADLRKIDITSKPPKYRGRWSAFLDAWDLGAMVINWQEQHGEIIDPDEKEELPF